MKRGSQAGSFAEETLVKGSVLALADTGLVAEMKQQESQVLHKPQEDRWPGPHQPGFCSGALPAHPLLSFLGVPWTLLLPVPTYKPPSHCEWGRKPRIPPTHTHTLRLLSTSTGFQGLGQFGFSLIDSAPGPQGLELLLHLVAIVGTALWERVLTGVYDVIHDNDGGRPKQVVITGPIHLRIASPPPRSFSGLKS